MYQSLRRIAALIVLAFCFASYTSAGEPLTLDGNKRLDGGSGSAASTSERNVAEFLMSDGSFDVGAANVVDFQGPIDTRGFAIALDEVSGAPKFISNASSNATKSSEDDNWSTLETGIGSVVLALAVYNGALIAAGAFTEAGDTLANRIASWDGSSWSALGTGMNNIVLCLVVYDNKLIAGGMFDTAGGVSAREIASWNGSTWTSLGSGMDSAVYALAIFKDTLYAGGIFSTAGGISASHIAKWGGTAWGVLGVTGHQGTNGDVNALASANNKLYVAGNFNTVYDGFPPYPKTANFIASWTGSEWVQFSGGTVNHEVYALTTYANNLIVGGNFDTAGTIGANKIATWNWSQSTWSALDVGLNAEVHALCTYFTDYLYVGGDFTTAGGNAASKIAQWDGSSWESLGSGVNGAVKALATHGDHLIVGGYFTTAGGNSANYIARWTNSPDITNCPDTSFHTQHHLDFSYGFTASDQENEPISWEIVSVPGSINSSTGAWTWNPPCDSVGKSMSLVVCAKDSVHTCPTGKECTVSVEVQNSAPDIGGQCGKTITIGSAPGTATFSATDPNTSGDSKSWSITGVSPTPYGSYSINSSGELTFDPESSDTTNQDFVFGVRVTDCAGAYDECNVTFRVCEKFPCLRGDANGDSTVNALDETYLINFLYKGGPAPATCQGTNLGDANNSGSVNAVDVTFLINYLYKGGAAPVCP